MRLDMYSEMPSGQRIGSAIGGESYLLELAIAGSNEVPRSASVRVGNRLLAPNDARVPHRRGGREGYDLPDTVVLDPELVRGASAQELPLHDAVDRVRLPRRMSCTRHLPAGSGSPPWQSCERARSRWSRQRRDRQSGLGSR